MEAFPNVALLEVGGEDESALVEPAKEAERDEHDVEVEVDDRGVEREVADTDVVSIRRFLRI